MARDSNLHLTDREIAAVFIDPHWAERYPPILTLEQAADLLQVPKNTLYQWRSRGWLSDCSRLVGKHVRVYRDRLVKKIFNEGLHNA